MLLIFGGFVLFEGVGLFYLF